MSDIWWTTEKGLLPNFIKRERINQTEPFFVVANPEGIALELSYADIDNAANRAAWFLSKNLAQDEEKFFYMGRMDLRYYIWALAAMKAGKCVCSLTRRSRDLQSADNMNLGCITLPQ